MNTPKKKIVSIQTSKADWLMYTSIAANRASISARGAAISARCAAISAFFTILRIHGGRLDPRRVWRLAE